MGVAVIIKGIHRALLLSALICSPQAIAEDDAGVILQQMRTASQQLNYQLAFINVNKLGIEPLQYSHVVRGGEVIARLLQMDGPKREVIQRGDQISFFETGLEPFTLKGDHIVDSMPSVVFADFKRIGHYYDFIHVGRMRVADRGCEVVRIVAQDGTRYSYVVWLDEQSKLPLRADLLDLDGEILEQFRVIALTQEQALQESLAPLAQLVLPPVLSPLTTANTSFNWQVGWLPPGFREVSHERRNLPGIEEPVESRLLSDGLFSFSVNINSGQGSSKQLLRQGRRTIHIELRNNHEIMVIGELPPATAKKIAERVTWQAKPQ